MSIQDTDTFKHFLGKAQDAIRGGYPAWSAQSTGERVAVALALNRADWLAKIDYTLAEAIDRLDADWLACVRQIERTVREEGYQPWESNG